MCWHRMREFICYSFLVGFVTYGLKLTSWWPMTSFCCLQAVVYTPVVSRGCVRRQQAANYSPVPSVTWATGPRQWLTSHGNSKTRSGWQRGGGPTTLSGGYPCTFGLASSSRDERRSLVTSSRCTFLFVYVYTLWPAVLAPVCVHTL